MSRFEKTRLVLVVDRKRLGEVLVGHRLELGRLRRAPVLPDRIIALGRHDPGKGVMLGPGLPKWDLARSGGFGAEYWSERSNVGMSFAT